MKLGLSDLIASIFFPRRCLGCGGTSLGASSEDNNPAGALCEACRRRMVIARTLFCGACGARLFGGKMQCHPDFPYILGAAGNYGDPAMHALVHALKFRGARRAAGPLVAMLQEYLLSIGALFDGFYNFTVVPIPLSRRRLRARGFNQASLLAVPVAQYLGLPHDEKILLRVRHTRPQTEMKSARERRMNLRNCFLARAPLAGRNILLVDDVTTTGTTFLEAAHALKRAGAGMIVALAALHA